MITNIGTPDRILRVLLGLAMAYWFWIDAGTGMMHWAKLLVALILIITAAVNFCPLYRIFGWSTKA
jgi:Protein of unknown function (DUF2892)